MDAKNTSLPTIIELEHLAQRLWELDPNSTEHREFREWANEKTPTNCWHGTYVLAQYVLKALRKSL